MSATRQTEPGKDLKGRVALVAGATRGAGRGIAIALGERGATVYCTGRSTRAGRSPMDRPETIEETADLVRAAGGEAIAIRCDHADEADVARLCEAIRAAHGGLDLLINDVWGGEAIAQFGVPLAELSIEKTRALLDAAVVTHLITAKHATPLLAGRPRAAIVEITDGDGFGYRGALVYDLVKMAVIRLAFALSKELAPQGITALAITPGFLRSEQMLAHFGVTEETYRQADDPHFVASSETPRFVGRAVAAIAADPAVARRNGRVFASWTLAREYGFTDVDGSRPDWGAYFARAFGQAPPVADEAAYASWQNGAFEIAMAAEAKRDGA